MANATGLVDEVAYSDNVIQLRDAIQRIEMAVVGDGLKRNSHTTE